MSDDRIFEGKDLDEALQAASSATGVPEDDIHYEMVEQGRKGLFGLGAKSVRIRMMPPLKEITSNELLGAPPPGQQQRRGGGRGRGRTPRQPTSGLIETDAQGNRPQRPESDGGDRPERAARGGGGGRAGQGGRGGGRARGRDEGGEPRPEGAREGQEAGQGPARRSRRRRGRGRGKSGERSGESQQRAPQQQRPPQPTGPPVDPEHAAPVAETLGKMISIMGLEVSSELASLEGAVTLTLAGDDSRMLRDKNKELLRAMQFLLNRMARRNWPEVPRVRLVCPAPPRPDAPEGGGGASSDEGGRGEGRRRGRGGRGRGGDRNRGGGDRGAERDDDTDGERDEELIGLGREVAQQVSRTKEEKLLEPMNAYERRLIHLAVREFDDLDSFSQGDGSLKRVLITPLDNDSESSA